MLQENLRTPYKIISPEKTSVFKYFKELWTFRYLLRVFVWQDLNAQFAQTKLSFLWLVIRPLILLGIFTFVFDKLIHIPGQHYPYPLFAFSGLLVWNNFSSIVNTGSTVLLHQQSLIKKLYFPKLILLISKVILSLIELGVSLLLLTLLILFFGYSISLTIVFLPFFLLVSIITASTLALWVNILTIRFRDLIQLVPIFTGFLIWLTPVFYPTTLIPEKLSFLLYLNPVAASIQGCRWAILGDSMPSLLYLPAFLIVVILLVAGIFLFIKKEGDLADFV